MFIVACTPVKTPRITNPVPQSLDPFVATVEKLKRSVAPVVCLTVTPQGIASLESTEGTAFFVSADGTFVTAGHVIDGIIGPRPKPCQTSAIYLPINTWKEGERRWFKFVAGECATIRDFDIARCKAIDQITVTFTPVELEDAEQPEGTAVAFTGFPLSFLDPLTARGGIAVYTNKDTRLGRTEILIDRTNWPGASGSPVYLENGRVIGILVKRGTGDSAGITVVRPSRFIRGLLAEARTTPK